MKLYSIKLNSVGRGNLLLILMIFSSVVLFLYPDPSQLVNT
jgi:hypothetical protein